MFGYRRLNFLGTVSSTPFLGLPYCEWLVLYSWSESPSYYGYPVLTGLSLVIMTPGWSWMILWYSNPNLGLEWGFPLLKLLVAFSWWFFDHKNEMLIPNDENMFEGAETANGSSSMVKEMLRALCKHCPIIAEQPVSEIWGWIKTYGNILKYNRTVRLEPIFRTFQPTRPWGS